MLGIGSGGTFQRSFQAAALVDQLFLSLFKLVGGTTQLKIPLLGVSFHILRPLLLLLEELRQESLPFLEALPEHVCVDR